MPESAQNNPPHQHGTQKVSYLLLLLLAGLTGLLYGALVEAGWLTFGSALLFIGLALYRSWKERRYLGIDGFGEEFGERAVQVGSVYVLVLVGGLVMWNSFQPGAEHSQRGIAAVLLCLGAGMFWRRKHLFSFDNIVRTWLVFMVVGAFTCCVIGVSGLITGYKGRVFLESISPGEALQNIFIGISVTGILAIEFWFPSINAFVTGIWGKEQGDIPWRSF